MVAIAAAAFALDGLATDISALGEKPSGLPPESPRWRFVWETLKVNFDLGDKTNSWPPQLKELFNLRSARTGTGGLAHPKTVAAEPVLLPDVPPAPARMLYTTETSDWAVALFCEIVVACSAEHLRLGSPTELVDRVTGYKTYAEEFARRQDRQPRSLL